MNLAILVPVWPSYRWLAPCLLWALDRFWPEHPPVWFCGMTPDEAGSLPLLPWTGGKDRTNWTALLQDGVAQLERLGVTHVYVIAEEHLPLAPCNAEHLQSTLPRLMEELPAVYISLMGWDNRRFSSKSPVLGRELHRLKHLTGPRAIRGLICIRRYGEWMRWRNVARLRSGMKRGMDRLGILKNPMPGRPRIIRANGRRNVTKSARRN